MEIVRDTALEQCKASIEQRLGWGDSAGWTSQDFEDLSLRIQEATGRVISATTLKRIWGRAAYHSRPSRHSLDTLAAFSEYPSWRELVEAVEQAIAHDAGQPEATQAAPRIAAPPNARTRSSRKILYLCCSAVVLGGAFALWAGLSGSPGEAPPVASSDVYFRSRPVAQGVPNTVIFEYNVRGIQADSFFIQQSWDPQRRSQISPENQTFTSTYYYPGFFNARLVADTTVLKRHPLHVTTDGWLALVDKDPVPIYLKDAVDQEAGHLSVSSSRLREQGIDTGTEYQVVSFYNVRPFDSLHTDRFSLEATLRLGVDDGRYPCKRAEITVMGERGAMVIPLSIPGCIGDMGVMLGDTYLGGSTNDLSAFGTDLSTWQRLSLEVNDRTVRMQVGANAPFTSRFTMDVGHLVGLRFRFEGTGAIDHVALKDGQGKLVYEDAF